ncbi:type II toxin-antitoxin system HicB family antitoxin [Novosphingobium cyanobacteriorum]|uniref:Type II toxin-antitoxin system HicB family antitoxin n=1 Tax=Novosphingobium cyanobacteriorum TaxID=3024215 RepID=A0ABT6CER7_9SPHN|nr:type II toxin-antitoxin system HicB family antitoxin [Novosphingobium cyanobacteriorum]MDF8332296.1 type II toxin-antitoxin system HicB family antitoxin [Novosphingobium cyanobacteriorum]
MKYFYAVVHKDADSAFGVHFPDLPGCFSAADEVEQLVPNACEALELWFEDADGEVEPRSVEAIRQAVAEELAVGAFLIAVPHIRRTGKQVRANISMDRGMLDAIDRAAAERHLTRSAFLADAARNEIEQRRA